MEKGIFKEMSEGRGGGGGGGEAGEGGGRGGGKRGGRGGGVLEDLVKEGGEQAGV